MGFDMSLADLFAAADSIADHRSEEEREAIAAQLREAQAELAEAMAVEQAKLRLRSQLERINQAAQAILDKYPLQ